MPQQNVMQQFLQFSNQMRGSNPQQMVQNLVNSGKLTPQMYSQIEQMMEQFGFHK
jgi:transcription initiation factor IIF auxiliary subunit